MNHTTTQRTEEEWLKVLGKGMVTLPKKWQEELGITTGDIVKAKKVGKRVVIESRNSGLAPYRVFTDAEIDDFLEADKLPTSLIKKLERRTSPKRS